MADVRYILGDCLDVMRTMADASADAVVADPPAGIGFMSKKFDTFKDRAAFVDFLAPRLAECLRVAKPGARMLCWALPRTSHWTATAVEDSGWIIEDRVAHLFGSGFPKAKSKLKPAYEDWYMARKPCKGVPDLPGLDACRVAGAPPSVPQPDGGSGKVYGFANGVGRNGEMSEPHAAGRYPSHLVLSHSPGCVEVGTRRVKGSGKDGPEYRTPDGPRNCYAQDKYTREKMRRGGTSHVGPDGRETVAAWRCEEDCPIRLLDEMSGERKSGERPARASRGLYKMSGQNTRPYHTDTPVELGERVVLDSGGASRFFATFGYFSKASRRDRGDGNTHPCVKSQPLMRWLIRLITPPGGHVLDPFAGTASTLLAAIAEGMGATGIESDPDYYRMGERRLAAARDGMLALS